MDLEIPDATEHSSILKSAFADLFSAFCLPNASIFPIGNLSSSTGIIPRCNYSLCVGAILPITINTINTINTACARPAVQFGLKSRHLRDPQAQVSSTTKLHGI